MTARTRSLIPLACSLALAVAPDTALAQRYLDAPLKLDAIPSGFVVDHADFDADGDVDLLGQTLGDLFWLVNDGQARFTLGPALDLPTANVYAPKVIADFDGDGRPDLAVAVGDFQNPTGVLVHLGTPSGYGPGQFLPTPAGVAALVAGQIDADPEPELAFFGVTGFPTHVVGWIDVSGGVPAFVGTVQGDYPFGINALAALDVDGDGRSDAVVSSENRLDLYVTGAGGAPTLAGTLTTAHQTGSYLDLATGDLDGDGDLDLVSWDLIGISESRIIALESTPGGLVEHPATEVGNWLSPRGYLADWDGDGDLDLFANDLVAVSGVDWMQVRNDGGFQFSLLYSVGVPFTGFGGGIADFDGDGFLDSAGPQHVFFGDGTFGTLYPGGSGGGVSLPLLTPPVDAEGDGDLDLAVDEGYRLNDASGDLAPAAPFPPLPDGLSYSTATAIADFDGNGGLDWLVRVFGPTDVFPFIGYQGSRLLFDDGLGGFVDAGFALPKNVDLGGATGVFGDDPGRLVAFDVDGDQRRDLVVDNEVWTLAPDDTFSGPTPLAVAGLPVLPSPRYQPVDVDADGVEELLVAAGGTPSTLRIVERGAGGALSATLYFAGNGVRLPATVAEVGGGPELDLVFTDEVSSALGRVVFLPGAPWGFTAPVTLPVESAALRHVAFDDVDGDGIEDLLVGGRDSGGRGLIRVRRGLGPDFAYGAPLEFYVAGRVRGFADLDQDGDLDGLAPALIQGLRFDGPDDGLVQQYGAGTPGAGGAVPVLGATGPVRSGSTTAALRLRRAVGGTLGLLAISTDRAALPGAPFPGLTTLVDPLGLIGVLNLPVPGSGPGAGELDIPVGIAPALLGQTFTHQFFLLDAASPSFLTQTNGLEIRYGL